MRRKDWLHEEALNETSGREISVDVYIENFRKAVVFTEDKLNELKMEPVMANDQLEAAMKVYSEYITALQSNHRGLSQQIFDEKIKESIMKLHATFPNESSAIEAGLKENINTLHSIGSLLNGKRP